MNIKNIISVDIGEKNLCFHILTKDNKDNKDNKEDKENINEEIQIYDITTPLDTNRTKKSSKGFYSCNRKILLNKKCFFIITNLILKYKPDVFVIEKQLNRATNNILIQTIIESILSICQINFVEIEPSLKYDDLKAKFKIKHIVKSQLIKMIDFNINEIKTVKMRVDDDMNISIIKIKKFDDAIDCKIITNLYLKNI